ncbi:MAG: glycosyltransferase [Sedimentisphaerales bacterium]|nr:glycosyltransferase [Sedimentisphaerales bacterium]
MDITIIIPVYNEEAKINKDIISANDLLVHNHLSGQIIVVDDGSEDGTVEIARQASIQDGNSLLIIPNQQHLGKGFAIRTGISHSLGDYVMFADSGRCIPFESALVGLKMIKDNLCDIAHASRKLPQSIINNPQSLWRKITSRIFRNLILAGLVPRELTDTQCGFKVYKGDLARKLYTQSICNGFMLDVEIIIRALKQNCRIKEFPVEWTCDPDSRLSLLKNLPTLRRELKIVKSLIKSNG